MTLPRVERERLIFVASWILIGLIFPRIENGETHLQPLSTCPSLTLTFAAGIAREKQTNNKHCHFLDINEGKNSDNDKDHDEDDGGKPAGQVNEVELPNSEVLLLVNPLYHGST